MDFYLPLWKYTKVWFLDVELLGLVAFKRFDRYHSIAIQKKVVLTSVLWGLFIIIFNHQEICTL